MFARLRLTAAIAHLIWHGGGWLPSIILTTAETRTAMPGFAHFRHQATQGSHISTAVIVKQAPNACPPDTVEHKGSSESFNITQVQSTVLSESYESERQYHKARTIWRAIHFQDPGRYTIILLTR